MESAASRHFQARGKFIESQLDASLELDQRRIGSPRNAICGLEITRDRTSSRNR